MPKQATTSPHVLACPVCCALWTTDEDAAGYERHYRWCKWYPAHLDGSSDGDG